MVLYWFSRLFGGSFIRDFKDFLIFKPWDMYFGAFYIQVGCYEKFFSKFDIQIRKSLSGMSIK